MDDRELLDEFVKARSQSAFRELVARHLPVVYSAARRMVRDSHLAEEVAQSVFTTLAQKAESIRPPQVLGGWLYNTTRHLAMHAVRTEQRRREREQTAFAMQALDLPSDDPGIAEHLEPAMAELDAEDRDALVLRFLANRGLREVGAELGVSEEAARKRVTRALERLRTVLETRGVTATGVLLATALTASTLAVPIGLGATVATTALTGISVHTSTAIAAAKAIAMTTLQKTLVGAILVAAVGTGIYEARKASNLRHQVNALEQQQTALTEQLTSDRAEATRRLAAARDNNITELARLRGEVTRLRRETQELARLNVNSAQPMKTTAQATPQTFENQGMATPEAGFQTFLWAAKNGDSNLIGQILRWRKEKEDAVSDELANQLTAAQARGMLKTFSNLASVQIIAQRSDIADTTRMRVEFNEDNGKTHLGEIYMIREGGDWKPALNFSRREGSSTMSVQYLLPTTPELGPTTVESAGAISSTKSKMVPLRNERLTH